jgi:hypothetical protein
LGFGCGANTPISLKLNFLETPEKENRWPENRQMSLRRRGRVRRRKRRRKRRRRRRRKVIY